MLPSGWNNLLTKSQEWQEVELMDSLRDVITQVSTCIFLGPELCQNKEWIANKGILPVFSTPSE
jgi:hypothetical protein